MELRKLKQKDAPLMLEWMHDENVTHHMARPFSTMTLENCEAFIERSQDVSEQMNLAVVDDNDTYMGTVSLKDINHERGCAEFAIIMRTAAMGQGFSRYAIHEIIRIGFEEVGLSVVYWCVSAANDRAIRFYDKNGFRRVTNAEIAEITGEAPVETQPTLWYRADPA